jgi:O-antigen/teichoic acid export membrane protein
MKTLINIISSRRFLVLGDQGIYSATSFLATLFFARLLSAHNFGIFSSLVLINFLIISITNALVIQPFQVNTATIENKASYHSFTFIFQLILTATTSAILYALCSFTFLTNMQPFILSALVLSFGFILHDFFRKSFLAENKVKETFFIDLTMGLGQFTALVLLYSNNQKDLSYTFFYSGLAYLPALFLSLFYFNFSFSEIGKWKNYLTLHFSQGLWLLMVAVLQWGSNNLFVLTSGILIGIEALGALRLVQSLFGVLNVLLQTFENYVLPQATRLYTKSVTESKMYLRSISGKAALIFGSVLLLLCLFSTSVITLAGGEKYAEYSYLMKGMALLYFILFIGYPIRMSIRMLILNKSFFTGYLISFLFTLATYNFFIQHWQLGGVIAGLIINQLVMLLYWQYQLSKNKFYLWK